MTANTQNPHLSEEQIFNLLDGDCAPTEVAIYNTHLANCASCHALWEEYSFLDSQLKNILLEKAPENFTDKVMDKWQVAGQTKTDWVYRHPPVLAWVSIGLITTLLVISGYYSLLSIKAYSLGDITQPLLDTSGKWFDFNGFLQQEWIWNGFFIINGILALMIMDKVLFRPFFEKKRQALIG